MEEFADGATEVSGHFIHEIIALGMDGTGIEWMRAVADAEESGGLLKGLGTEAGDFQKFVAGFEGAVLVAKFDDALRGAGVEAGDIAEEMGAGGVEFHADMVHARDDSVIERALEGGLVDIVLVLADADGFGVDFDEFGERVHEAASNGNGTAHREVEIREFLAGDFRGGVDRRAGFAHDDNRDGRRQAEGANEGFGFARGGAVTDGDGFDFETGDDRLDDFSSLGAVAGSFFRIDDFVHQEFSLGIEHDKFAAGAEAGVEREGRFLTERRGEEKFADVFGKDADGFLVGFLFIENASLALHSETEEALVAIMRGEADLLGGGVRAFDEKMVERREGLLFQRRDAGEKQPFGLAAADGEEAVRRALGDRLAPIEVVFEFRGVLFFFKDDFGFEGGFVEVEIAQRGAGLGGVVDALGEDVARSGEGGGGVGDFFFGTDKRGGFGLGIGV